MSFLQKLWDFEHAANVMFPARELEPTIVKDYPQKWVEILRRRRMLKSVRTVIAAMWIIIFAALFLARCYPNFVTPEQLLRYPFSIVVVVFSLAYIIVRYRIEKFECPRCRKTFDSAGGSYSAVSDDNARCQHCKLQIGGTPKKNVVR